MFPHSLLVIDSIPTCCSSNHEQREEESNHCQLVVDRTLMIEAATSITDLLVGFIGFIPGT